MLDSTTATSSPSAPRPCAKTPRSLLLRWTNLTATARETTAPDRVLQHLDLYDDERTPNALELGRLERDALQDEPPESKRTET